MDFIEDHAYSLLEANKDNEDFTLGGLEFALQRVHGRSAAVRMINRLVSSGKLELDGRRPVLSE